MILKIQQVMLAAMARTAVPLPIWARSIFTRDPRLSPPRRLFGEAALAQAVLEAQEAATLYILIQRKSILAREWFSHIIQLGPLAVAAEALVAASAAQPTTSARVAPAEEEAEAAPQVLFKANMVVLLTTK